MEAVMQTNRANHQNPNVLSQLRFNIKKIMFKKGGGGIMSKVNKLKTKIWLHAILFYNLKCTLTFFIKRILSFIKYL